MHSYPFSPVAWCWLCRNGLIFAPKVKIIREHGKNDVIIHHSIICYVLVWLPIFCWDTVCAQVKPIKKILLHWDVVSYEKGGKSISCFSNPVACGVGGVFSWPGLKKKALLFPVQASILWDYKAQIMIWLRIQRFWMLRILIFSIGSINIAMSNCQCQVCTRQISLAVLLSLSIQREFCTTAQQNGHRSLLHAVTLWETSRGTESSSWT